MKNNTKEVLQDIIKGLECDMDQAEEMQKNTKPESKEFHFWRGVKCQINNTICIAKGLTVQTEKLPF